MKVHEVDELELVYLTVHLPDESEEVFFPLAADEAISMERIAAFQDYLLQQRDSKRYHLRSALPALPHSFIFVYSMKGLPWHLWMLILP